MTSAGDGDGGVDLPAMPDATRPVAHQSFYELAGTAKRPLPSGEPGPLTVGVVMAYDAEVMDFWKFAGQTRSRAADLELRISGHHRLATRGQGGHAPEMTVARLQAHWDAQRNRVRFGHGIVEITCCHLRSYGLGALLINHCIAWAEAFHADADIEPVKSNNPEARSFWESFGFVFAGKTDPNGYVYALDMPVSKLRPRSHPLIIPKPDLNGANTWHPL